MKAHPRRNQVDIRHQQPIRRRCLKVSVHQILGSLPLQITLRGRDEHARVPMNRLDCDREPNVVAGSIRQSATTSRLDSCSRIRRAFESGAVSCTNQAAAFEGMSRSSLSCRFSRRKRAKSCRSAASIHHLPDRDHDLACAPQRPGRPARYRSATPRERIGADGGRGLISDDRAVPLKNTHSSARGGRLSLRGLSR
jgi:hypothetical protein